MGGQLANVEGGQLANLMGGQLANVELARWHGSSRRSAVVLQRYLVVAVL